MSIFTERDFNMLAQGYLLKDILKDHVENYDELYRFYTAFYKEWSDSVDNRRTFLKEINRVHDSYAINLNEFWLFAGDNVRIKIFINKSIFNLPTLPLIKDTTPKEDFTNAYPACKEELIRAIIKFFVACDCSWEQFLEAWNNSIMSTNDRMYLEFPLCDIPSSKLTLSFPKKYLIGDYDD